MEIYYLGTQLGYNVYLHNLYLPNKGQEVPCFMAFMTFGLHLLWWISLFYVVQRSYLSNLCDFGTIPTFIPVKLRDTGFTNIPIKVMISGLGIEVQSLDFRIDRDQSALMSVLAQRKSPIGIVTWYSSVVVNDGCFRTHNATHTLVFLFQRQCMICPCKFARLCSCLFHSNYSEFFQSLT